MLLLCHIYACRDHSSVLSSSLHQVISPSMGDNHVNLSNYASYGYSQQINYHIYILSNHHAYDPTSHNLIARLKSSINQLKCVPLHTFIPPLSFALHHYIWV
jgi:hypothetical protein